MLILKLIKRPLKEKLHVVFIESHQRTNGGRQRSPPSLYLLGQNLPVLIRDGLRKMVYKC